MARIFFYTRPGCHLCDTALAVLEQLQQEYDFQIEKVDISLSPRLEERYGTRIPVAELNGRPILKYRADERVLRRALAAHARL